MSFRYISICLSLVASIFGCTNALSKSANQTYEPPFTYEKYYKTYQVHNDGSYEVTTEIQLSVNTLSGVNDEASQTVFYNATKEDVLSIEAWTIQPDGVKIKVPDSSIFTQNDQIADSAAEFSDSKVKVIVFPRVEPGCKLYYKTRLNRYKPIFPDVFFDTKIFNDNVIWKDVQLEYVVPKSMKIYEDKLGVIGGLKQSKGEFNYYKYRYISVKAFLNEPERVNFRDYANHLSISTLPDMVAIGHQYQITANPKSKPNSEIKKLARKLTKGVNDERLKVKRLYEWVAMNIRYVSVAIGDGGVIPRHAAYVLKNRYGDCKDHAVLLEALLDAVGITSSPALVNLGDAYKLSKVGVIQPINHVISYVPSLDLYLDSTVRFTPFGSLIFEEMDKPTILTALGIIGHTPKMQAHENKSKVSMRLDIDKNGEIHGQSYVTYTGVREISSRSKRFDEKNISQEQLVKELLQRFNETGYGSIDFPPPERIDQPYWIKSKFRLNPISNIPGRGAMTIPVGMAPGEIAWAGIDQPRTKNFDYVCESKNIEENYVITFPSNVQIDVLPQNIKFKNESVSYVSTYTRNGKMVSVKRELSVNYDSSVCGAKENEQWQTFHKILQKNLRSQILYR